MSHTQGPWKADGKIIAAGRTRIALVEEQTYIGSVEVELPYADNAKVLAAAPEMLSALETVLFGLTDDVTNNDGKVDIEGLRAIVKSAIAKAKGV